MARKRDVTFKVEGISELRYVLRMFGDRVANKLLKRAIRIPAKAMEKQAKLNIRPARQRAKADEHETRGETGLLRRSIGTKIKLYKRTCTAVGVIGPRTDFRASKLREKLKGAMARRRPSKYAHLVEYGTKPHRQKYMPVIGGVIHFKNFMHPGTKARPFLRPAYEKYKHRASRMMAAQLRRDIPIEARRLAAKQKIKMRAA